MKLSFFPTIIFDVSARTVLAFPRPCGVVLLLIGKRGPYVVILFLDKTRMGFNWYFQADTKLNRSQQRTEMQNAKEICCRSYFLSRLLMLAMYVHESKKS